MSIHEACKAGDLHAVENCVLSGGDLNIGLDSLVDDCYLGMTPLMLAVRYRHEHLLDFLVNHGAKIDAKTKSLPGGVARPTTVLELSVQPGWAQILAKLIAFKPRVSDKMYGGILLTALERGATDCLAILLQSGFPINAKDGPTGRTLLHSLVADGLHHLVADAIKQGANINAQDKIGATPLMVACNKEDQIALAMLIKAGADVTIKNKWGEDALIVGVYAECLPLVRTLIEHGMKPIAKNRDGQTAIEIAEQRGLKEIARELSAVRL